MPCLDSHAERTWAMFSTCRISAKLGGTYLRLESAKNSSYSRNASTSLSGVKNEPCNAVYSVDHHLHLGA